MKCELCPRHCGIDRSLNKGFCGVGDKIKLAKVDKFMWEEPVISGENGSGAIFFSGCNLKCCFCQNFEISHNLFGQEISTLRLAEIFKELEEQNVNNINLVSPTCHIKQIIEALKIYRPKIPIVYNSNGYETLENIKLLEKFVDIYLVDLKFYDENLSLKFCKAKDYFKTATNAILEMVNQKKLVIENDVMKSGVIVRHMVMPNCTNDSLKILNWLAENVKNKALISLMSQYTPCFNAKDFQEINRPLKPIEYKKVLNYAIILGFNDCFAQEMSSCSTDFIPKWDLKGI